MTNCACLHAVKRHINGYCADCDCTWDPMGSEYCAVPTCENYSLDGYSYCETCLAEKRMSLLCIDRKDDESLLGVDFSSVRKEPRSPAEVFRDPPRVIELQSQLRAASNEIDRLRHGIKRIEKSATESGVIATGLTLISVIQQLRELLQAEA